MFADLGASPTFRDVIPAFRSLPVRVFLPPPPEPGDHGAAETVDERQSAGIREEDKAESVKREAGL